MQSLASLLVHKPLNILVVAVIFAALYLLLRFTDLGSEKTPGALLVPAAGWALYAVWEWLVMTRSPEANIRVDLMLIWPLLLVVSIWFLVRALR